MDYCYWTQLVSQPGICLTIVVWTASDVIHVATSDVAPCGACWPCIFFINGVLCILKINGNGMEMEERWLETPHQGEDESRRSSASLEAMDKSLKLGEDEWKEREKRSTKFCASNEVWTLKCNSQIIKVEKMHTHGLYL